LILSPNASFRAIKRDSMKRTLFIFFHKAQSLDFMLDEETLIRNFSWHCLFCDKG